jgi:hypothetical protein
MDNKGIVDEAVCHIPDLNVYADSSSKNTPSHSLDKNGNQLMTVSDWVSPKQYQRTAHRMGKMADPEPSSILKK